MKNLRMIFYYLMTGCLFGVVVSCVKSASEESVEQAERIMEENADSALVILKTVKVDDLQDEETRKLYDLLLIQSRIKTGERITDDSIINDVVSYYYETNDKENLTKALFYKAEINYNNRNFHQALLKAAEARSLAVSQNNTLFQARSAEMMGFVFGELYNHPEAVKIFKESEDAYKKSGRNLNVLYSVVDRAINTSDAGDNAGALRLLDSLEKSPGFKDCNRYLEMYICKARCGIYILQCDYKKAYQQLGVLAEYGDIYSFDIYDYACKGQCETVLGDTASAVMSLQSALDVAILPADTALVYKLYSDIYKGRGDYYKSAKLLDTVLMMQNKELHRTIEFPVYSIQREIYDADIKSEREKKQAILIWGGIVMALLVITALAIIILFKIKIRMKNLKIESYVAEAMELTEKFHTTYNDNQTLSDRLTESENTINELINQVYESKTNLSQSLSQQIYLQQQLEKTFREKWSTLNMLCAEYFEKGSSSNIRGTILNDIETHINSLSDKASISKIRQAVNSHFGDILQMLNLECPFLSDSDITFLALIYAGFKPRAICMVMKFSLKNYYSKRARIIERITRQSPPHLELFLGKLK